MRLAAIIALAGCLVAVGPTSIALGGSPSPQPAPSLATEAPVARFVLPAGGYAIVFPVGWAITSHSVAGSDIPVVRAQAPLEVGASAAAFCEVKASIPADGVPFAAVQEAAAREVAWFQGGTDAPVPDVVESAELPFASMAAAWVHTVTNDPPSDRTIHFLTDGRVFATLLCIADAAPEDGWRSVVMSFTFLPAP